MITFILIGLASLIYLVITGLIGQTLARKSQSKCTNTSWQHTNCAHEMMYIPAAFWPATAPVWVGSLLSDHLDTRKASKALDTRERELNIKRLERELNML